VPAEDGTFQAAVSFSVSGDPDPLAEGPASVAVADLDVNVDTFPDLVTANFDTDNVSVLLGIGDGTFQPPATFKDAPDTDPASVAVDDINGDTFPDLVTANWRTNDVSVFLGDGNGAFPNVARGPEVGTNPNSVAVANINVIVDTLPDVVTANLDSDDVSVLVGNGDGTFQNQRRFPVGEGPASVAVALLDGGNVPDLVTANLHSDDVSVLLGFGGGGFQPEARFPVGRGPVSVAVALLDGGNVPDLVTANLDSDDVSVLLGNGDGTFQDEARFPVGFGPFSVAVDDVNDDTFPDLVTANEISNDVSVLLGNGDGTFQAASSSAVGDSPQSVAVGDLDGDTLLDLGTANYSSGDVSVLLNQN
jgi:hypothetical protein